MSAINKALTDLAKKDSAASAELEPAVIPSVKRSSPKLWIGIGVGFSLSIGVGSWAVSQQASSVVQSKPLAIQAPIIEEAQPAGESKDTYTSSPTNKMVAREVTIFEPEVVITNAKATPQKTNTASKTVSIAVQEQPQRVTAPVVDKPILIAKNTTPPAEKQGSIVIQKVELTTEELAQQSIKRAEKALDSNELNEALSHYEKALRYTPQDEVIRQKLAALYYGKKDSPKAFDILQEGIRLNTDSERLRLNLSQLLVKEGQNQAALTPLVHLNDSPSVKYLSMRAALAQQLKKQDLALESYQKLVLLDETNGRWWLGLGIQRERNKEFAEAKVAYENALTRIGLSSQSQNFIKDRLSVLKFLEENPNAN